MLGRLRIRGRLTLLVVIPLLSTIGLAVPVLGGRIESARAATDTVDLVRRASQVGTVVQDLQLERLLSVGYLMGAVDRSALVKQSAQAGDRIADLRADIGDQITPEIRAAIDGVSVLAELRAGVLARRVSPDEVINRFGHIDSTLIDSVGLTRYADGNTETGRQMIALDAMLRTDEGIGEAAALIILVAATKSPVAGTAYVATMAELQSNLDRFRNFATPEQNDLYLLVERATEARTGPGSGNIGALDPATAVAGVPLEQLFPSVSSLITLGQFIEKKIVTDVVAEVSEQRRQAIVGAYGVGLLVLGVIALMMLLSLAVARTVARPLTRLTVSAERIARAAEAELTRIVDDESDSYDPLRLDPVDVRGRDEIGDLARAFERVQGTAARLVERQAASRRNVAQMFGHVGRRTQNLVGRQIALIDRLEHRETDPGRLQHLYRLDHVSSRLRRNASSLVVLSGGAGGDGHMAPLPLGDVVRLALGEIEDFTRVDVQVRLDVAVAPGVIGDLVLTLAELMENATAFSPPHTRVTVLAEVVPGGVRLNLVDYGIGMTPERLAEENARLTRRERLDLVPTEVLGLFVVGRLARRHGWRVILSATTPGGGVTVGVEIDDQLLITRDPEPPVMTARASASAPLPVRPVNVGQPPGQLPGQPLGPAGAPPGPTAPDVAPVPVAVPVAAAAPSLPPGPTPAPAPNLPPMPYLAPLPERLPAPDVPPVAPVAPVPELVPAAASSGPVFDAELISRATRSLRSGKPWNAFLTRPDVAAEPVTAEPVTAGPVTAGPTVAPTHRDPSYAPGAGPDSPARTAGGTGPANPGGAGGTAGGPGPAAPGLGAGLRQRVPGAQLPATVKKGRPEPTPADPSVVRALIEEFEAGVRRAQREQLSRPTIPAAGPQPAPVAPAAGPQPAPVAPHREQPGDLRPDRTAPVAATTARTNGTATPGTGAPTPAAPTRGGPTPGAAPPRLNRRVPGANLSVPPMAPHPGQPSPSIATAVPDDPDRVRELMMQFESGVARALSEVRPDNRHEEGTPR